MALNNFRGTATSANWKPWKQLAFVPFKLGDYPLGAVPALGLIDKSAYRTSGAFDDRRTGRVKRVSISRCNTSLPGRRMA